MNFLYSYAALGVFTAVAVVLTHLVTRDKPGGLTRPGLDRMHPKHSQLCYFILNDIGVPVIAFALIVIAWPVVAIFQIKALVATVDRAYPHSFSTLSDSPLPPTCDPDRKFAVGPEHLIEKLSLQEIEAAETVGDPMMAVPLLPFGHLNSAWVEYASSLVEGCELWSFSAEWETRYGDKEAIFGYVSVVKAIPGPFFVISRTHLRS